jgi:hypothetical protein
MERDTHYNRIYIDHGCKGTQEIVDDLKSSNPHSIRFWFKHQRQLQTFAPVNNVDYNPTLPTAS